MKQSHQVYLYLCFFGFIRLGGLNARNGCHFLECPAAVAENTFDSNRYQIDLNAMVALWPPKPRELLNARRIFFSRAVFGT